MNNMSVCNNDEHENHKWLKCWCIPAAVECNLYPTMGSRLLEVCRGEFNQHDEHSNRNKTIPNSHVHQLLLHHKKVSCTIRNYHMTQQIIMHHTRFSCNTHFFATCIFSCTKPNFLASCHIFLHQYHATVLAPCQILYHHTKYICTMPNTLAQCQIFLYVTHSCTMPHFLAPLSRLVLGYNVIL